MVTGSSREQVRRSKGRDPKSKACGTMASIRKDIDIVRQSLEDLRTRILDQQQTIWGLLDEVDGALTLLVEIDWRIRPENANVISEDSQVSE